MKKNFVLRTAVLTAALTASFGMTAFAAGHWEKDAAGYWWQEEDGSYPVSCWKWLDGNNDGIAESYYFDASGYMAADTTVDGKRSGTDPADRGPGSCGSGWTVPGEQLCCAESGNVPVS